MLDRLAFIISAAFFAWSIVYFLSGVPQAAFLFLVLGITFLRIGLLELSNSKFLRNMDYFYVLSVCLGHELEKIKGKEWLDKTINIWKEECFKSEKAINPFFDESTFFKKDPR